MVKTGFVVAATNSGAGKTTLSLGIMAALKRRGWAVQPFKIGPDFIDPGHHTRLTGRYSRNLDGWMLSRSYNQQLFFRLMQNADCAVVEGVMGLYDGFDAVSDTGSTAEMAKWLNLPVILVVNAASMARSAAAMVKGFESFDRELNLVAVIFNRVGSPSHLGILKRAVSHFCSVPCIGGMPKDERIAMPERHLGLVTSDEHTLSSRDEMHLASLVEENIDMESLIKRCKIPIPRNHSTPKAPPKTRVQIAIARDPAFCFYYPDNLEILESFGAKLIPFSPLSDKRIPGGCQGIYLGGGYPEEFAEKLAGNASIRMSILEAGKRGVPIYGECGGFMYLCREIETFEKKHYPLVGLFPFTTRMLPHIRALGYREIRLKEDGPLGPAGLVARGHEFHYSEILGNETEDFKRVYVVIGRKMESIDKGFRFLNTLASYIHLHFGSNPEIAKNWVDFCAKSDVLT